MKNLNLRKVLAGIVLASLCGTFLVSSVVFGAPTQAPNDALYVSPTFKNVNVQEVLDVKNVTTTDPAGVISILKTLNIAGDLGLTGTKMLNPGANGKAALKISAGATGEWLGFVPGLLYYYAPDSSAYKNMFLWAQNGSIYIGASSTNKNDLIVSGDGDIRGALKNNSTGNNPIFISDTDGIRVNGSIRNDEPFIPNGCGITHPCPPVGTTEPVTIDDGLKVTGMIDGSGSLSVAGDITSQGSYRGGFDKQNFSNLIGECTVPSGSGLTTCQGYCSDFGNGAGVPVNCGYIVETPNDVSTVVYPNALYADWNEGKCVAKMRNVSGATQKVYIKGLCLSP